MMVQGRPLRDPDTTLPGEAFVHVTALAASLLSVPVAVVLTGGRVGPPVASGDAEIPDSIVAHVDPSVLGEEVDLTVFEDPRDAKAAFGLAFHASASVTTTTGREVGRFSIFDHAARRVRAPEQQVLDALAGVAAEEIELWLDVSRARDRERAIADFQQRLIQDTDVLMAAMREVSAYEDPAAVRPAICRIALSLSGADAAALYEISHDDAALIPTATAGHPAAWADSDISDRSSAPARAFVGGKAILVDEGAGALDTSAGRPDRTGAEFWQPFAAGGSTGAAVIGLAWVDARAISPVRLGRLMDSLAAEAMRAIERADLLVRLEGLARTDEVTGLPNRRALNEALERELQRARREGHTVCVGILDLDHFKRYNDALGHLAGDRFLADVSSAWRDALRDGTDVLARFGGEEFVVVLPATMDAAFETLERMRERTPDGQTVSAGLASWDPGETAGALLARADAALYRAKAAGRDRIERAQAAPRAQGVS